MLSQEGIQRVPVLALRDMIIYPYMVVPLYVGREKSINALENAVKNQGEIFLLGQKDASILNPGEEDLYRVGTLAKVVQILKLPDGTVKVLIEGKFRGKIKDISIDDKMISATITACEEVTNDLHKAEAVSRSLKEVFEQYAKLNKKIPPELIVNVASIKEGDRLSDIIIAHLNTKLEQKQEILEILEIDHRLEKVYELVQGEIEIINIEKNIKERVKGQMERSQKEYYLNEQLNAIQRELGRKNDPKSDILDIEQRLNEKQMPIVAKDKTDRELKRLKMMSPMTAEAAVIRNYVELMLDLPWLELTSDNNDIDNARNILDNDHHGLDKVKDRIIEFLAVKNLTSDTKGTILCLSGPPGVGKTSIGKSLASALEKKFVRISLGGIKDEAEIRGHRKTYVGAMPGKIISAIKRAGSSNPLILLDEIDKMTSDMRGDPASAMLEVLDPEQNSNFVDHFIEVEYDLSKVMFVMTANDISKIPKPLLDRMEIIELSSYLPSEKLHIGKKHLLPKVIKANGLSDYQVKVSDDAMTQIIKGYTREAGVRELERQLNTICRKIATSIVKNKTKTSTLFKISKNTLGKYLGQSKFQDKEKSEKNRIGQVHGLAWTTVGGEVLNVEVVTYGGTGKIQVTGKLGEIMQESAQAALSYIRSIAPSFKIEKEWFSSNDIHIHVPDGATPKDGPSAGITLATAIASAIFKLEAFSNLAMTGEISITGEVLPIGGLKEKLMAAKLLGIETVIIPQKNMKDVLELSKDITEGMNIIPCEHMSKVLQHALNHTNTETKRIIKLIKGHDTLTV